MSSNQYGYVPKAPTQSWGNNDGVFSVNDVRDLIIDGKFSTQGDLELIETKAITGVSSSIFTSIQESTYSVHFLTINDFVPVTDGTDCRIRFFESGTEESASVYQYSFKFGTSGGSFSEVKDTSETYLRAMFNTGNSTNETGNSYTYFYNLGNSSMYSYTSHHIGLTDASTVYNMAFGGGVLPQTSTVDQIKLYNASGNFSCTASLYGVRTS